MQAENSHLGVVARVGASGSDDMNSMLGGEGGKPGEVPEDFLRAGDEQGALRVQKVALGIDIDENEGWIQHWCDLIDGRCHGLDGDGSRPVWEGRQAGQNDLSWSRTRG